MIGVAARAVAERDGVLLLLLQQAQPLELGDDALARDVAILPGERPGFRGHLRVEADDLDALQVVPVPDLEVGRVMRGRDLDRARAERLVNGLVCDDRDAPVHDRQDGVAAHEVAVARVVGIDGDGGVAQDRLRARRGDGDVARVRLAGERLQRIANVVERPCGVHGLDLEVGDRAQAVRTPVDDALAAIDQSLLIEADEDLADGARQPLVQCEALALPVAGGAEAAVLILDAALVAAHPVPDALDEGLTPDLVAIRALFG